MSLAFDAITKQDSSGYVNSLTFSHTTSGSNRGLVLGVSCRTGAADISGATYGGVSVTAEKTQENTAVCGVRTWSLIAPASGANNVVISLSNYRLVTAIAISFTDVDQTDMIEAFEGANAYGATATDDIVTVTDNAIVVDFLNTQSAKTVTVGAGQTERSNSDHSDSNLGQTVCSTEPKATAGTVTMSHAWTGDDNWALVSLAIKPFIAGGSAFSASLNEIISVIDNIAKKISNQKIENIIIQDFQFKKIYKININIISISDFIFKKIGNFITNTVSILDNLSKNIYINISNSIILNDFFNKKINTIKNESIIIIDNFFKKINKNINISISIFDILQKQTTFFIKNTLVLIDTIYKKTIFINNENISLSDFINKKTQILKQEINIINDFLTKKVSKIIINTVTLIDIIDNIGNSVITTIKKSFLFTKNKSVILKNEDKNKIIMTNKNDIV